MKEKIEEVQAYFKAKLLAGEFTVLSVKFESIYSIINISIDGYEFAFYLWSWDLLAHGLCFIKIDLNEDELLCLKDMLSSHIDKAAKEEKLAQFEKLQKELFNQRHLKYKKP